MAHPPLVAEAEGAEGEAAAEKEQPEAGAMVAAAPRPVALGWAGQTHPILRRRRSTTLW
jgi:hypothetical protein